MNNLYKQILISGTVVGFFALSATLSQPAFSSEKAKSDEYWKAFKQDADQSWNNTQDAFRDGWIESKLETAIILSEHLNPFDIDIRVDKNVATLEGEVDSQMIKDHVSVVALGVEGIDEVNNSLVINQKMKTSDHSQEVKERSFSRAMKDAAITAEIKTELLANSDTQGLSIDVDTRNKVVTLSGVVDSGAERSLAEYIAKTNDGVKKVNNELEIDS